MFSIIMQLRREIIEKLLTESEAEKALRLPDGALTQLRYRGRGPEFTKVGRYVRYDPAAIHRFVVAHTRSPSKESK